MQTLWESRYAQRTQRMGSSAIRELLKLTENPDIISFGGGMPAPDVFPVEDFAAACDRVLGEFGAQALQMLKKYQSPLHTLRFMVSRICPRWFHLRGSSLTPAPGVERLG